MISKSKYLFKSVPNLVTPKSERQNLASVLTYKNLLPFSNIVSLNALERDPNIPQFLKASDHLVIMNISSILLIFSYPDILDLAKMRLAKCLKK